MSKQTRYTIKRYTETRYVVAEQQEDGASRIITNCSQGEDAEKIMDALSHHAYVRAKVKEAIKEERKRCRDQEVKLLMDFVYDVFTWGDGPNRGRAEQIITAVEKTQKEQPL